MIGDLQISNSDDWDLDWDLDIFETMIEGVILISFFSGVPNSTNIHIKEALGTPPGCLIRALHLVVNHSVGIRFS